MSIMTELVVSVVGGVLTALILAMVTRRSKAAPPIATTAPSHAAPRRSGGFFADFLRMVLAVLGGIAIAMIGGRMLIQAGVLPAGVPTRLGVLVAATMVLWLLLGALRSR